MNTLAVPSTDKVFQHHSLLIGVGQTLFQFNQSWPSANFKYLATGLAASIKHQIVWQPLYIVHVCIRVFY